MHARTTFAFMMAVAATWYLGRPPRASRAIDRTLDCVTRAHNQLDVKVQEVTFVMQP